MMQLSAYRPKSQLVTSTTQVEKPEFKVIDAHNHLGPIFGGGWDQRPLANLLDRLDEAGVVGYVDLDGGWGEDILQRHLEYFKQPAPERFQVFGGVDWAQWAQRGPAFADWAANRLRVQHSWGAQGLKIWKSLGLQVHDEQGQRVAVDDVRLAPIWETASELGWPVIIHVADPVAFFDPIDEANERWEELGQHPDWAFTSPPYPSFIQILTELRRLVRAYPKVTFIGAHVGCYAENLAWVGNMLAEFPNYFVDISARIAELGRQPYTARRFFIEYQDRILFGSDMGPDLDTYRLMYRFLESDNEYFAYGSEEIPTQGRWRIYGLHLPEIVLKKVYYENADRILWRTQR